MAATRLRYLAWRYQVNRRDGFEQLTSVKRARAHGDEDLGYYLRGQKLFAEQIRMLSTRAPLLDFMNEKDTRNGFSAHAPEGQRYVRWRGLYCGTDEQLNALRQAEGDGRRVA